MSMFAPQRRGMISIVKPDLETMQTHFLEVQIWSDGSFQVICEWFFISVIPKTAEYGHRFKVFPN